MSKEWLYPIPDGVSEDDIRFAFQKILRGFRDLEDRIEELEGTDESRCYMLLEDGSYILLETGDKVLAEACASTDTFKLILENGDFLVTEDDNQLVLEVA